VVALFNLQAYRTEKFPEVVERTLAAFSPLELIGASNWRHVAFTTYALSLSFFEAVVLDALVRRKVESSLILADVEGVSSALSEHGARRVGRDYDLEPIAVSGGVFHPKLTMLSAPDDTHLLVGSGNLTFGGWGGNLECLEHLHPSFAGDAFVDASSLFQGLAASPRIRTEAQTKLGEIASTLRRAGEMARQAGDVRLVHSLDRSISDQIVEFAEGLGGATRICAASPFWDGGRAITELCRRLSLDHAYVHAHPEGVIETGVGENWPRHTDLRVQPVQFALLAEEPGKRRLHAKMFEVLCSRGRLVISGSANATQAALGPGSNVEASVVRIQRERQVGWMLVPSSALSEREASEESTDESARPVGVLRATLEGEIVSGRILTPFANGSAIAYQVSSDGQRILGEALVAADGRFSFRCEDLEREAWNSGRLILRISAPNASAEGFVSFADLQAVRLRAGPMAAKLLAILNNGETPADAAAIMSWFHDQPDLLKKSGRGSWSGTSTGPVTGTTDIQALLAPHGQDRAPEIAADSTAETGWERFIASIFSSFSSQRGPFSEETSADADSEIEESDPKRARLAASRREIREKERKRLVAKALEIFDKIFEKMIGVEGSEADFGAIFALAQYVCERLRPEEHKARDYLYRLVTAFVEHPQEASRTTSNAAVVVAAMLDPNQLSAARRARSRLLRLGWSAEDPAIDLAPASGFQRLLCPNVDPSDMLAAIRSATTISEEIRLFRAALDAGGLTCDLPILGETKEWKRLQAAFNSDSERRAIKFVGPEVKTCPCSYTIIPSAELNRLKASMIASPPCGHILLCEGL
jgi:hypothetical protein